MIGLPYIDEYIVLHPNGQEVAGALLFAFGPDEAIEICKKAILNKKKIILKTDAEKIDYLEYSFK